MTGKSMRRADRLSRRADWTEGVERDNKNQVMLKKKWLEIRKSAAKDNEVIKSVEEIKKAGVKLLRNEKWQIEDDLVLKEGKVYVLRDDKLRLEIIWLHYDMLIAEHGEQWKMVELVTRNYWWPGVMKEVKQYVEKYDQCQRIKNRLEMLAGKLKPNEIPEKP